MSSYHTFMHRMPYLDGLSQTYRRMIWIGAVSFEERCVASLTELRRNGALIADVIMIEYGTIARPVDVDSEMRKRHREMLLLSAKGASAHVQSFDVNPYSYLEMKNVMRSVVEHCGDEDAIIVDITCLTKVHTIAISSMLSHIRGTILVAYTSPEHYNILPEEKQFSWKDIIISPISDSAVLFDEVDSRGIIITGFEAGRLMVSLTEIEPTTGVILHTVNPKRPDFNSLNNKRNRRALSLLSTTKGLTWKSRQLNINDYGALATHVLAEIDVASQTESPIILFPFGPKSLIFGASMMLSDRYCEGSWFIYPIPLFYHVGSTEGIASTSWLEVIRERQG